MRFHCLETLIICFGMSVSRIHVRILHIHSERRLQNRSTRYCTLLRMKGEYITIQTDLHYQTVPEEHFPPHRNQNCLE